MRRSTLLTALLTVLVAVLPLAGTAEAAPARTKVVLTIDGCDGCRVLPSSSLDDGPLWQTSARKVRDGKVSFSMPTVRTKGLRLALDAPFEGATGGVPHVVFHYQGQRFGEPVTTYAATTARKGSVCFSGTARRTLRLAVAVRQVMVDGTSADGEPVVGALAYTTTTQRTRKPFELVRDGYFAAQAIPLCEG